VMIVDRACGSTRDGSNRCARPTTGDCADSGAARRTYAYPPNRAADMVMAPVHRSVIAMLWGRGVSLGRRGIQAASRTSIANRLPMDAKAASIWSSLE